MTLAEPSLRASRPVWGLPSLKVGRSGPQALPLPSVFSPFLPPSFLLSYSLITFQLLPASSLLWTEGMVQKAPFLPGLRGGW